MLCLSACGESASHWLSRWDSRGETALAVCVQNLHQNSSTFPKPTFSSLQHDCVPPLTLLRTPTVCFWIPMRYGDPSDCEEVDHDGCCRRYYNYWNYLRCRIEGTAGCQTGMFNHCSCLGTWTLALLSSFLSLHTDVDSIAKTTNS